MQIEILLIDDHAILRKGLQLLLARQEDFTVVGEAEDGEAGINLIRELSPDIVIMDISMPGLNGIDATKRIAAEFPDTKVIALSIHSEKLFVEDMLRAGAAGYILKESVLEDLVRGIREVMNGASYLSPSITGIILSAILVHPPIWSSLGFLAQRPDKVMSSMLARKTFVLFAIGEWLVYGIVIKSTTY